MVAGHQAAGLQGGTHHPCLVVDLCPGHERVAGLGGNRVADEADTGRPVGRLDEAVDDRVRLWDGHRHEVKP